LSKSCIAGLQILQDIGATRRRKPRLIAHFATFLNLNLCSSRRRIPHFFHNRPKFQDESRR